MSELLKDLNKEQQDIIRETDGYKLILAGAGTGKTMTLTYNIVYLIEHKKIKPWNILAVTFTNKAAQEMKERIGRLINIEKKNQWWIGTFHGICVRILIKYGAEINLPSYFSIADEREQRKFVKQILEENTTLSDKDPDNILQIMSWAKNNLIFPIDLMTENEYGIPPYIGNIYAEYQERLMKANVLDFDDLIMRTIQLFQSVPKVKEELQEQFKYILVDESQDLNKAQFEIIKILSEKHQNLSLIGDNDQGIYSWRGANIDIILNFAKDQKTKIMKLETNYRCTKMIISASNAVIKKNMNRIEKTLVTENVEGNKITLYTADNEYQEAEFVASIIDYCSNIKRTHTYKDFTILYRTNSQSRVLEDQLSKLFIPYQIIGSTSFYDRKEVKDMMAYIKLIVNPYDILSFQRIANEPKRGAGDSTLFKIIEFISNNNYSVIDALDKLDNIKRLPKKTKEAMLDLQKFLFRFVARTKEKNLARLIRDLATESGYLNMLEEDSDKDRILNIYELSNIAEAWSKREDLDLFEFVQQMSLITENDMISDNENSVKLMTVHTAKGLEFHTVFIVGLEENIFPHFLALSSEDINQLEEERRLMYVSMTRAMKELYLSNTEERRLFGKTIKNLPSRFLKEIPSQFIKKI